jgi:predicted MFS family arabinose efflux permease
MPTRSRAGRRARPATGGIVMADKRLVKMLPYFAALFIDTFSFGLMYPVVVALFHFHWVIREYPDALRNVYLALAFSLFPLGMCFGASLLGDLSDALGRKRTMLICMAGLTLAYALMWLGVASHELLWFLGGRLVSGLMAGTGPIAQAAMMDASAEDERGRRLANVVLVNSLALVSAPALGGLLGHYDFRAPILFAAVLCVLVFAWIWRSVVEPPIARKKLVLEWSRPVTVFTRALRHPEMSSIAASFILFQLGMGFFYLFIMVKGTVEYHMSPLALGLLSATMGAGFVIGSTVGYARALARFKSDRVLASLGLTIAGALTVVAAAPIAEALAWACVLVIGAAGMVAYVATLALISKAADASEQGWALGVGSAIVALAFFVTGLFASTLHVLPLWMLIGGGGLLMLAAVIPLRPRAARIVQTAAP